MYIYICINKRIIFPLLPSTAFCQLIPMRGSILLLSISCCWHPDCERPCPWITGGCLWQNGLCAVCIACHQTHLGVLRMTISVTSFFPFLPISFSSQSKSNALHIGKDVNEFPQSVWAAQSFVPLRGQGSLKPGLVGLPADGAVGTGSSLDK